MGIGGAMMWPAILGMTYAVLPEAKAGLAGGLILGAAGFGNALGPLLGGLLTDALSWRWILFVNLPVAALAIFVTLRAIAPDRASSPCAWTMRASPRFSLGLLAALSRSTRQPVGLDGRQGRRRDGARGRAAVCVSGRRASRRRGRTGASRRDRQPHLRGGVPGRAADVGG